MYAGRRRTRGRPLTVDMSESRTLTANAVPHANGCVRYSSVSGSSSSSWSRNCTLLSLTSSVIIGTLAPYTEPRRCSTIGPPAQFSPSGSNCLVTIVSSGTRQTNKKNPVPPDVFVSGRIENRRPTIDREDDGPEVTFPNRPCRPIGIPHENPSALIPHQLLPRGRSPNRSRVYTAHVFPNNTRPHPRWTRPHHRYCSPSTSVSPEVIFHTPTPTPIHPRPLRQASELLPTYSSRPI